MMFPRCGTLFTYGSWHNRVSKRALVCAGMRSATHSTRDEDVFLALDGPDLVLRHSDKTR